MAETIENKLRDLGIVLPPTPAPLANYVPFIIAGDADGADGP
jgi:hypothetical protein